MAVIGVEPWASSPHTIHGGTPPCRRFRRTGDRARVITEHETARADDVVIATGD
ncbi:hypothetical protein IM697_23345 [Streptomyces ferrugineus]|uniref:Uncharacterized protein n=1 Tax=Streptomyces ferrugineus TaxID=1413221 RepID=A0A7M2SAZ0_9ACTN|nr:hypothetical protein [Streptomyces ferrugineus]QOV33189.1 hypothetical protein IM697_23345 [Streptomyces ferrugineus]